MLSKNSISRAASVVASLESAVVLTPIEGTPVDQVVTETMVGAIGIDAPAEEKIHLGSMAENPLNVVTHDVVSEEVIELVAPAIGEHFRFARHVVNPAIRNIVAVLAEAVGQRAPLHNVSQFGLAQAHANPVCDDLINRYAGADLQPVAMFSHFPEKTEAELTELLKTGSSTFDTDMLDLVAARPVGWLNGVYSKYFREGGEFDQTRDISRADDLLVVHLWCMQFDNNPPAGTMMSLEDYNQRITALQAQSGNTLVDVHRRWDRLVTNGTLVWKYPPQAAVLSSDKDGAVIVIAPVWQRFIAEGGCPEIVFGASVTDRNANVVDLLTNRDQYLKEYNRFVDRQTAQRNAQLGKLVRAELSNQVSKLILSPEAGLPENTDIAAMQRLAAERIAVLKDHELVENTTREVRWVLGTSLYAHTNALEILETVDKVIEDNPGMSPSRAATKAAIRLVVKHLMSQLSIRKAS